MFYNAEERKYFKNIISLDIFKNMARWKSQGEHFFYVSKNWSPILRTPEDNLLSIWEKQDRNHHLEEILDPSCFLLH